MKLVDAIEHNNTEEIRDELGDLLFHIIFLFANGVRSRQLRFCRRGQRCLREAGEKASPCPLPGSS